MFDFLKTFGLGILYVILSPILIALALIYMVYSFFVFIFMFIKRIVMFFAGENMKEEMKIDRLAKLHIQNQDEEKEVQEAIRPTPVVEKTTTVVQPIIIQTDENGVLKNLQVGQVNQGQIQVENQVKPLENKEENEEDKL